MSALQDAHAAYRTAALTLRLLSEAEELPGRAFILRAVRAMVKAHRAHFNAEWRMPGQAVLPALIHQAFDADLEVERAREEWRRFLRLGEQDRRHVRTAWREKILALTSLDDVEKAQLAASLRATHAMEADDAPGVRVTARAVEIPAAAGEAFREAFTEAFEKAMRSGAQSTIAQVGLGADWLLKSLQAEQFLRDYAGHYGDRLSRLVVLEHQEMLREEIIAGLDAGDSAQDMGTRIRGVFADLDGYQAERIARTEAVRARTEGSRVVYAEEGVQEVEWVVAGAPCDICEPLAGTIHRIDSPNLPPKHVHCLCVVTASEADLDRMRRELVGPGTVDWEPAPSRYAQEP